MKIRPLNDWVVLKPGDEEERTAGGIIIPDVAKEKPQWGEVVVAGTGRFEAEKGKTEDKKKEKRFIPTEVKPGDRVLYEKYMAREVELDGQTTTMIREEYILGLLEPGNDTALQKRGAMAVEKSRKGTSAVEKSKKGSSPVMTSGKGKPAATKSKAAPEKKTKK